MRKSTLGLAMILVTTFAVPRISFARGGHGSSHKGGHYRNARTRNHYEKR